MPNVSPTVCPRASLSVLVIRLLFTLSTTLSTTLFSILSSTPALADAASPSQPAPPCAAQLQTTALQVCAHPSLAAFRATTTTRKGERWTAAVPASVALDALRIAASRSIAAAKTSEHIVLELRAATIVTSDVDLRLTLTCVAQLGSDATPTRLIGRSFVTLDNVLAEGQMASLWRAAVRQAARQIGDALLAKLGKAADTTAHRLRVGLHAGGAMSLGIGALWHLSARQLVRLSVNPLYPDMAISGGWAWRAAWADMGSLWLHAGAAWAYGAIRGNYDDEKTDKRVPFRVDHGYAYVAGEVALRVGTTDRHRLAVQLGFHLGKTRDTRPTGGEILARPYGGVSYYFGL